MKKIHRKDLDAMISGICERQELPPEEDITNICKKARELLSLDETVLSLSSPITVVGDLHGQIFDFLEVFKCGGKPPDTNYLFLGDYVDRGLYSIETFLLLIALKLRYPKKISLLRGNHESRTVTQTYGLYDECIKKFGNVNVWRQFTEIFDSLSLTALIDNTIFCVHGGLSPEVKAIDTIREFDRFAEIPKDGPISDFLWSDPDDVSGWAISPRGAGFVFGADVVKIFNNHNSCDLICRAHQLTHEGFRWMFKNSLITVWSAPNYCGRGGNFASILAIDGNSRTPTVFRAAPDNFREPKPRVTPEYFL